ncbi:unnamed protein product [Allacma fusca]|uniref:Uncharacterized protein n=1 Tax=Allacma fusca TaxID=39272 RepID=A0A8J2NZU1_9HEXA|nr:unnamed protein product [Allacma fusca]
MHMISCKQLAYLWRFNGNEGFNGATVGRTDLSKISKDIQKIKRYSKIYNRVAGNYVILIVLTCILCLIDVARSGKKIGDIPITSFLQLIVLAGLPLLPVYVGNYMRNEVYGSREILSNAYGLFIPENDPDSFNTHQLERITKWLLDWDWKFTARNVFDVNYKIFGVVSFHI